MNILINTVSFFLRLATLMLIFNGAPFVMDSVFNGSNFASVYAEDSNKKKRRYPALRSRVFAQLETAQKLADEGKVKEGLTFLKDMERRVDQLNSYEAAMVYNFMAFIHYGADETNLTIRAFQKVLEQDPIPETLEQSTLYSLAQLNMQIEKYDEAINYINRWSKVSGDSGNSKSEGLLANAYYAKKDYPRALKHLDKSIALEKADGGVPAENVLILKRAVHYELNQPKLVTAVSEDLVRYYSKPKYWIELGNMYGEVGEEAKQMAVMEAAHQQGYVTKGTDLKNLAQLYYMNGAPFKAAKLMDEAFESDKLEKSLKNLEFQSQAWMVAKEFDKAIPVLEEVASQSDSGDAYGQLAEVYVNQEEWIKVIEYGEKALDKGQLKDSETVHIAMGMAYFNLKQYDRSTDQFTQAKSNEKFGKMAEQWIAYVSKEKSKRQQLVMEFGEEIEQL
ncbi:MAG: hypothetical protein HWE27_03705 [Gammaproteobacteria bacterium]|nr:hypothetical protein [Gammaproteobacteria bacterium]